MRAGAVGAGLTVGLVASVVPAERPGAETPEFLLAPSIGPGATAITAQHVQGALVAAGLASGVGAAPAVRVTVGSLPGGQLAMELGGSITVDATAAGHGWDVVGGAMDLVGALAHEIGHAVGRSHTAGAGLMAPVLQPDQPLAGTAEPDQAAPSDTGLSGSVLSGSVLGGSVLGDAMPTDTAPTTSDPTTTAPPDPAPPDAVATQPAASDPPASSTPTDATVVPPETTAPAAVPTASAPTVTDGALPPAPASAPTDELTPSTSTPVSVAPADLPPAAAPSPSLPSGPPSLSATPAPGASSPALTPEAVVEPATLVAAAEPATAGATAASDAAVLSSVELKTLDPTKSSIESVAAAVSAARAEASGDAVQRSGPAVSPSAPASSTDSNVPPAAPAPLAAGGWKPVPVEASTPAIRPHDPIGALVGFTHGGQHSGRNDGTPPTPPTEDPRPVAALADSPSVPSPLRRRGGGSTAYFSAAGGSASAGNPTSTVDVGLAVGTASLALQIRSTIVSLERSAPFGGIDTSVSARGPPAGDPAYSADRTAGPSVAGSVVVAVAFSLAVSSPPLGLVVPIGVACLVHDGARTVLVDGRLLALAPPCARHRPVRSERREPRRRAAARRRRPAHLTNRAPALREGAGATGVDGGDLVDAGPDAALAPRRGWIMWRETGPAGAPNRGAPTGPQLIRSATAGRGRGPRRPAPAGAGVPGPEPAAVSPEVLHRPTR